jgi:CheY-like chemotaxis protein
MARPKKVILLVDDDEFILSTRRFILTNRGYRVISASTVIQALEVLESAVPDSIHLLLTDLVMPGADGDELARRSKQIRPEIPVMIISGTVRSFDRAQHADVFLPKGTGAASEVLERIRILVARKRGPKRVQIHSYRASVLNPETAA